MSRREFNSSQKRRLGEEITGLEPSTSRLRRTSPPGPSTSQNYHISEGEFSESDVSDEEYVEVESESEDEYLERDAHVLDQNSIEKCKKRNYANGWQSEPPNAIDRDFHFQPDKAPKANFNTEPEAFLSLISPGIVNM